MSTCACFESYIRRYVYRRLLLHMQEAGKVPTLKDRALVAQKNADIRKRKQGLLSEIEKLRPLVKKGKAVTKEIVAQRQDRVWTL